MRRKAKRPAAGGSADRGACSLGRERQHHTAAGRPSQDARSEVVRALGVFCAAWRFDTLKLVQEIALHWPDATAAEIAAAMSAGVRYLEGVDE